jgi:MFS family permease
VTHVSERRERASARGRSAATSGALRRKGIPDQPRRAGGGARETARSLWRLVRDHEPLQAFLIANGGLGFLVPFLFASHVVVAAAVPFIAVGGGVIMALPYAVLMPLMPEDEHGAVTGCYSFSRGLGTWLGPLLAGIVVTTTRGIFHGTQGYQGVSGVCAVAVLLSLLPLEWLRRTVR